jgi:hypothetical protein
MLLPLAGSTIMPAADSANSDDARALTAPGPLKSALATHLLFLAAVGERRTQTLNKTLRLEARATPSTVLDGSERAAGPHGVARTAGGEYA